MAGVPGETILLRRYTMTPDGWDDFIPIWRRIIEVRRRHGFSVLFALFDRQSNAFT